MEAPKPSTALAKVSSASPSYTAGQFEALSVDTDGALRVSGLSGGSLVAGTALIGKVGIDQTTNGTTNAVSSTGFSFLNVAGAATTVVKSGAGQLHLINVNTLGTVASTLTVYDNTAGSGTIIAIIDSLTLPGPNLFDINFTTGCTVVSTTTAALNFTVAYR